MAKERFISLDGVDGAGKSTQCALLADWLREQGFSVLLCQDPGGTDVGQQLRQLLLHSRGSMALRCEALLFMASRAQLVEEVIRPALLSDKIVISDRYLLANVVYQGHAGGLDPQTLWSIGSFAMQDLEPDITFVLDLPLEVSFARRKSSADRMESRDAEYYAKVREGFLQEARRRPERFRVIDATASADQVQEVLRREIHMVLKP
jgi:dTMP kinase